MTKRATRRRLAALRHCDFPSSSQMPHDEAWDRVAFFLLPTRYATGGMGPVAGTHDNLRAVHTKVRRSQAGEGPPAADATNCTLRDQGVERGRANVRRTCRRRPREGCCFQGHAAYTQGKGRLRLSGCVLLAGTPQQRPSVSAYRHRKITCCERC
jgi:hypothetical protein